MLFEADPDHIASLDSVSLVRLMKLLMLAESRLAGVPLRDAAVPLQVTVADGGEDGRVEWIGGVTTTAYFPHRFTLFQSKAQDLTESAIKSEILKKPKNGPAKLSAAISEVLLKGGAYVVFCAKPFVTTKRKKLVAAIKSAIVAGGGELKNAAVIEVYDANLIANWVNIHPPVALWLASQRLGRNLAGFQTHQSWGRSPDIIGVPWKPSDEPRFAPVNRNIPEAERKSPARNAWTFTQAKAAVLEILARERAVVRLSGPSGFGKTRFVYEILGSVSSIADEIDNASVLYCDGSISGDDAVKLAVEIADASLPGILVVDECPDELHIKLAKLVQRPNSKLRLVTMDIETKVLQASDTLAIRVEKADDPLIQQIAKGIAPGLSDRDSRFIADLAEGFPSMAVMAAQREGDSRTTLESVEQILERIIWHGRNHDSEAQRALETACLFDWIGLQGRVEGQAAFIAAELAEMSTARFVEHVLSFRSRGILTQRGDFLQIGPVPLAARLGIARLSVMTVDQLLGFFLKAPEVLNANLLSRMKWVDTSATANRFAECILAPSVLGNFAALNTGFGAKTLDRLVHVAPDVASATIDRVFGSLSHEELAAARDGRRYLVWALEKLVFRRQTFVRSATLLRRLAAAENEDTGNNATGVFKQLYSLYLSGTEAEPTLRLMVLDEGLSSPNLAERTICVEALDQMLNAGHFSRMSGSEQIGSADALQDWFPATYGEVRDFSRASVKRLVVIATSNEPLAERAKELLSRHIRSLLSHLPVAEVRAMIDAVAARHGFWPEAMSGISDWLFYDRQDAPPEVAAEIRAMFDSLLPVELVEQAVLYTNGWQLDLHDPDANYDKGPNAKHDFDYAPRQAIFIAQQLAADSALTESAVRRLACSDGKGLFPFGKALAGAVPDAEALFRTAVDIVENSPSNPNRAFFGGLIAGADERDNKIAKRLVRTALNSPKLKAEAISLIGSGKLQSENIALVVSLLQSNDVPVWQCATLSYGRGLDHLDASELMPLLEELEKHGGEGLWTIIDIVGMYLHGGKTQPTKPLLTLIKRTLLAPELLKKTRNNMDGYHLEQMVTRLIKQGQVSASYAKRLTRQVMNICRRDADRLFYELDDPVRKILGALVAIYPVEVWSEVARKVTSNTWHVRFYAEHLLEVPNNENHLARGIAFPVPTSLLLDWVREEPQLRAPIAVAWLQVADKNEDGSLCWARELEDYVTEFGSDEHVLGAISGRFHPTSWWGSLAPILEPILPLIEGWLNHPNSKVRAWASVQADRLRKAISEERKRSEEHEVQFS